jgi:hypothetical protein
MTSFKKTVATAKAKVADADTKAFMARLEAIDAILQGATPHDVLTLCAHALAGAAPLCCEAHQDEFKAEFLRVLGEAVEIQQQEQDAAEAAEDDEAHIGALRKPH